MVTTLDAKEFQAELQRLDALLRDVERFPDPAAQSHMRAMVRAVLDLHGAGLARVLAHLETPGASARAALDTCVHDDVVGGLLLLHGLHPLDVEARVRQALDDVRPYLRSHGGNVELLAIDDGVVRLRLEGSCHGCPSSSATMRQTIDEAILAKAPDVMGIEVEGVVEESPAPVTAEARLALPLLST